MKHLSVLEPTLPEACAFWSSMTWEQNTTSYRDVNISVGEDFHC